MALTATILVNRPQPGRQRLRIQLDDGNGAPIIVWPYDVPEGADPQVEADALAVAHEPRLRQRELNQLVENGENPETAPLRFATRGQLRRRWLSKLVDHMRARDMRQAAKLGQYLALYSNTQIAQVGEITNPQARRLRDQVLKTMSAEADAEPEVKIRG